jgi:N-succinyldiaminopimelate aminotransferase
MFSSLSKRSNVPGMRSGFVAGDAAILKRFLLYRTYHGCAMARRCRPPRSPPGTTKRT